MLFIFFLLVIPAPPHLLLFQESIMSHTCPISQIKPIIFTGLLASLLAFFPPSSSSHQQFLLPYSPLSHFHDFPVPFNLRQSIQPFLKPFRKSAVYLFFHPLSFLGTPIQFVFHFHTTLSCPKKKNSFSNLSYFSSSASLPPSRSTSSFKCHKCFTKFPISSLTFTRHFFFHYPSVCFYCVHFTLCLINTVEYFGLI